jgi:hypothetical protein
VAISWIAAPVCCALAVSCWEELATRPASEPISGADLNSRFAWKSADQLIAERMQAIEFAGIARQACESGTMGVRGAQPDVARSEQPHVSSA